MCRYLHEDKAQGLIIEVNVVDQIPETEISVLFNLAWGSQDILEAYEVMTSVFGGDDELAQFLNEIKLRRQEFADGVAKALVMHGQEPPATSQEIVLHRLLRNLRSAATKRMKLAALGSLVDCEEAMTRFYLIQLDYKVSEGIKRLVDAQVEQTIADHDRLSDMLRLASTPTS